jgi:hypothetical protein
LMMKLSPGCITMTTSLPFGPALTFDICIGFSSI